MTASNVVSIATRRAEREGWEQLQHGEVDFLVFNLGNGLAEVRLVTGSAARDTLEVNAVQVCEATLDTLIRNATLARDAMRKEREAV